MMEMFIGLIMLCSVVLMIYIAIAIIALIMSIHFSGYKYTGKIKLSYKVFAKLMRLDLVILADYKGEQYLNFAEGNKTQYARFVFENIYRHTPNPTPSIIRLLTMNSDGTFVEDSWLKTWRYV